MRLQIIPLSKTRKSVGFLDKSFCRMVRSVLLVSALVQYVSVCTCVELLRDSQKPDSVYRMVCGT